MAGNPCNIIPDQEIVLEGGAKLVPAPEAADAGKVLGVTNQEGGIGWVESQGGTVDQTYNASSTNAQSGTAVAQAIASIPSSSYTAGNGIEINNDEISIDNTVALKTDIPTKGSLMVKSGTTQKELYDAWVAGWTIQSNRGNELYVYELDNLYYDFGEYTAIFKRVYFNDTLVCEDSFSIDGLASSTSAVSFGTRSTKRSNRVPTASSQSVGKVLTIKSVPYEDPIASWETPSSVTVDQTYNAASTHAQSGTAVAQAIASIPSSGGVPVLHSLRCQVSGGSIQGELPEGEYLEPGLYQIFLKFSMSEYNASYKEIAYGFQVEHSEWISGSGYYPVGVDTNGPFTTSAYATFMRTGYVEVVGPNEVSGLSITFKNGTSSVTGSNVLKNVSVKYMKIANLS